MKNTLQKIVLCATIAAFAQNSAALEYQAAFQADKDAFMEKVFFSEVKSAKKKGWKPVEANAKLAAAATSLAAGLYLQYNPIITIKIDGQTATKTTNDAFNFNISDAFKEAAQWGLIIVPAAYAFDTFVYKPLSNGINSTANETVLLDFLDNWETNKQFTPEKYHTFFDALAAAAQTEEGRAQVTKNAGDIIETIQFIIQRTKLEVSEVFKKGAFGEEGKDIYEVKPSFKFLKDFSPLKDATSVVNSLFGEDKK